MIRFCAGDVESAASILAVRTSSIEADTISCPTTPGVDPLIRERPAECSRGSPVVAAVRVASPRR